MQNKGLIKLFALLFGLVSIYQLSYTFITNKVEKEANVFPMVPPGAAVTEMILKQ